MSGNDFVCPDCGVGFVLKDALLESYDTIARCPGCGINIYVGYS
jgi:predicted RNA-binding Zn-ribbon protein involved in translation (DUF1610 family)